MVDALHENGIECLMELLPRTPSGFVLQVLHHWQLRYQIDGFIWSAMMHRWQKKRPKMHSFGNEDELIFLGFDGARSIRETPVVPEFREHNQGQYHPPLLKGDEGSLSDFTYYLRRSPRHTV